MSIFQKIKPPPMPGEAISGVGFQGIQGQSGNDLIGGMEPQFSGNVFGDGSDFQYTRYYEGAENEPYNWNPDDAWGLQLALVRAGYLGKGSLSDAWQGTQTNAYKRALADANRYGVSVEELLGVLGESGGSGGGGGGGGGGLGSAGITDEDITALANKVAQGVLGRNLRGDEIGNFIPAFRGALGSGTSPTVSAENLIRQDTAPVEAQAHDIGNALSVFGNLIGGR